MLYISKTMVSTKYLKTLILKKPNSISMLIYWYFLTERCMYIDNRFGSYLKVLLNNKNINIQYPLMSHGYNTHELVTNSLMIVGGIFYLINLKL